MKRILLGILLIAAIVYSCKPKFRGQAFGSYAAPDKTATKTAEQRDGEQKLFFVIAWIAKASDTGRHASRNGLISEIYGLPVHPSVDHRAVYALQPDGSLLEIPLKEEQITQLFNEMNLDSFDPGENLLWQREIAPKLVHVNNPGW